MSKKKKYTLSRQYINEFFGLFGTGREERKRKKLDKLIEKDPVLKKLDDKITQLNKKAAERMKDKTPDDDVDDILKSLRIDVK